MRRAAPLVACLMAVLGGCTSSPPAAVAPETSATWRRAPDLPVAVLTPAGSVAGRHWILTGGIAVTGPVGAIQVMDLDQLSWRLGNAALAQPRFTHRQIALEDGRVLVVGGQRFGRSMREYLPMASCELVSADGSAVTPAADLPEAIAEPTVHLLADGQVLAIGGAIASVYDAGRDRWSPPIRLAEKRRCHATVALPDGTFLVIAGRTDTVERLDLATGRSTLLQGRLSLAIDDTAAVALPDGRVWVLGGQMQRGGDTTDQTWIIDPGTGSVADGPRLGIPGGVADHLVLPVNGGFVLMGGERQESGRDTELHGVWWLEPRLLTATPLPSTAVPRDESVAVVDRDRLIVTAGVMPAVRWGSLQIPQPIRTTEVWGLAVSERNPSPREH